jgi:hypothetical protein
MLGGRRVVGGATIPSRVLATFSSVVSQSLASREEVIMSFSFKDGLRSQSGGFSLALCLGLLFGGFVGLGLPGAGFASEQAEERVVEESAVSANTEPGAEAEREIASTGPAGAEESLPGGAESAESRDEGFLHLQSLRGSYIGH